MSRVRLVGQAHISRRLSSLEYMHMAAGSSPRTLDPHRIISMILEGTGLVTTREWATALQDVAQANPGLRLRVEGTRQRARWTCSGAAPPQVRVLQNCSWDGASSSGMEEIDATSLPLNPGPGLELVVVRGQTTRLILRVRHALMDGMGVQHFFEELFRALRGEPLIGTNAACSDVELMRTVAGKSARFGPQKPIPLTGGARGNSQGDVWRRLTLTARPSNLLGQVAECAAQYAWKFREGPVRIAVPVDLRRHTPGLKSTMNYAGMVYVEMSHGEGAEDFRRKLRENLSSNADTAYPATMEALRYLPLHWVDRLIGRTPRNYLTRDVMETVLISNLGTISPVSVSCARFHACNYYCLPVVGNSHILLSSCGGYLNVTVGMPNIYASDGRLEELMTLLQRSLLGA